MDAKALAEALASGYDGWKPGDTDTAPLPSSEPFFEAYDGDSVKGLLRDVRDPDDLDDIKPARVRTQEDHHPFLKEISDKERLGKFKADINWLLTHGWSFRNPDELMQLYDDVNTDKKEYIAKPGWETYEDDPERYKSMTDEDRGFLKMIIDGIMAENKASSDRALKGDNKRERDDYIGSKK